MLTRTGSVTTGHRLSRTPAGLTQPAAVHRGGRASPQRSSYYSQDRIVYHHWPAGRPLRPPSAAPAGGQDPVRLVANLVDNAERYNLADGTISISTTTDNRTSLVRVVNTGPVVPPDQVDRLFLPFTRLDDRTRHDGFGLGLALVSSITAVHGGTVDATAMPAGGLDITIRLPRRQEQHDRAN